MIEIDNKVVSSEILEQRFCCNLPRCLGKCCVHGDSGAPLTPNEALTLEQILDKVKPYMTPQGIATVQEQGVALTDSDGDLVTPLIDGKECAFTVFENGIATCAIEKAWNNGIVDFRKPISCHLYPIRVKEYSTFTAINYHQWDVCAPARELGEQIDLPVYRFLKDAIIRAYGKEFYGQLEDAAKLLSLRTE
ncbi:MAG TPA: DUF3109 family protein [Tenuifilum sp.]|nr:DUF3109 family protein [Bacteroidales bacterium]HOK60008.1 DUF3109 family protein [Tenuifilum sp.]MBP9028437.1 DUF3109 family protein [Bacteroidales bacterium]HOK84770.1 DUF3109 family protein [Tenuifilum sp.]HON69428.1 DUF3109 family protein [Tenuifilum sp.]